MAIRIANAVLSFVRFDMKIRETAHVLNRCCPKGSPTEQVVLRAVELTNLAILFENSAYRLDPIRTAVVLVAEEKDEQRRIEIITTHWRLYRNQLTKST